MPVLAVMERGRALAAPLKHRVFRRFWAAGVLSEVGDWAARLALAVLVYRASGSAALTGLVTAVGLLAWLGPGQLLTALAERTSRRRVLVGCDLLRAAAFTLAALRVPLPVLLTLVFLAGLATPPAQATAAAIRPTLVPAAQVPAVHTLTGLANDSALLLGSALGGVLVAALGARGALLFNAATFAVSAGLLAAVPDPAPSAGAAPARLARALTALRTAPRIRRAVLLATLAMAGGTASTAMIAPYVLGALHRGPGTTAALTATTAALTILLTVTVVPHRADPDRQLRVIALLALVGGVLLCLFSLTPGLPLVLLALAGTATLSVVLIPASALVGPLLPDEVRSSAFSLLMGTLAAAQAGASTGVGALADHIGTGPALALLALPTIAAALWHLLHPLPAMSDAQEAERGLTGQVPGSTVTA